MTSSHLRMYLLVPRDDLMLVLLLTGWDLELDTAAAQAMELVAHCISALQELTAHWALQKLTAHWALQEQWKITELL